MAVEHVGQYRELQAVVLRSSLREHSHQLLAHLYRATLQKILR